MEKAIKIIEEKIAELQKAKNFYSATDNKSEVLLIMEKLILLKEIQCELFK